ncbi:MAG: VWA domain-containing protein [Spirochaetales bacterium]|nr:VWA domain-containing protein [Spirochaetales bacterium]
MKIRVGLIVLILFAATQFVIAENITVTQIDTSSLLLSQRVDLYINITDDSGNPVRRLQEDNFIITESGDGVEYSDPLPIVDFQEGINTIQGIHFLLLVDNSGSMYDSLTGSPTENTGEMRITHAKEAITSFVSGSLDQEDSVSLASFNTLYSIHALKELSRVQINEILETIKKPEKRQGYTELYAAIIDASKQVSAVRGRKVIIVLSDGENFPYYKISGESHPVFGEKTFTHTESIEELQKEGVTLYAINFGSSVDPNMQTMVTSSGGIVFDAGNRRELERVYENIRQRILDEYRITYKAAMIPADRKTLRLEYVKNGAADRGERVYFSGTLMGMPGTIPIHYLIIPLLAAILVWFLLSRIRFEKPNKFPNMEVLQTAHWGKVTSGTIALDSPKTVIGSSPKAGLTIAGDPAIQDSHSTILFDKKQNTYTIVGDGEMTVNNKPAKRRKLESGDVINIGGTTILFDKDTKGE